VEVMWHSVAVDCPQALRNVGETLLKLRFNLVESYQPTCESGA
jgi:hypothetical protein